MFGFSGPRRLARHLARPAPCLKDAGVLPQLSHPWRHSVDRLSETRGELRVRCVREKPEPVKDFLLFLAEVLRNAFVCPY